MVIKTYTFDDGAFVQQLSDNGAWAVAAGSSAENALFSDGARLVNVATGDVTDLKSGLDADTLFSIGAFDVSNDGSMVVGSLNERATLWKKETGKWSYLQLPKGCDRGRAVSMTPDGKRAVGIVGYSKDEFLESTAMWDLATGEIIPTPGLPEKDMAHLDQGQNRFTHISADGKMILGCMSVSYLPSGDNPGGITRYAYNVEKGTYQIIGFTESDTENWTPAIPNTLFIEEAFMSNNGMHVAGGAHIAEYSEGSDFPEEYVSPFYLNTGSNAFDIYKETTFKGQMVFCIDDNGHLYTAGPYDNPYREWGVRTDGYHVNVAEVLQQLYGISLANTLGASHSGAPVSVDSEGRTFSVFVEKGTSYIVQFPACMGELAKQVNLLADFSVSPKAGAAISKLQKISITFTRPVEVTGERDAVQMVDENGSPVYSSIGFKASDDSRSVQVTFRNGTLEAGKKYTLRIPANTIQIAGDASRRNAEINVNYEGRANAPVRFVSSQPEDGASLARIDASTSPLILTFDTQVLVGDAEARGELFREGETEAFAELLIQYGDNKVMLYPSTTQLLYKDAKYRVELPAGLVTDVTGNKDTGNEKVTLNFVGAYERAFESDNKEIFSADFSSTNGLNLFLLYDNDKLTPSADAQAFGFADASNYPWWVARDDNANDLCAASHSMYNPAGKSDDWMVTPQLHLPDMLCSLHFKAQSFKHDATDSLKVFVWENNEVYNTLSANLCERIRLEGKLLLKEKLSPGSNENMLAGDWKDYEVSLSEFAGKNVYIALLNCSDQGSLIFVDTLQVLHNIPFLVSIDSENMVVGKASVPVKGRVAIDSDEEVYDNISIDLLNAEGNKVDNITETGLSLKKGDIYNFAFEQELPLKNGIENKFTIVLRLNETENRIEGSVSNLLFAPEKRVVIEEFTGITCPNCPLGILAAEKIHGMFGERFILLGLHTYQGDPLGTGLDEYSSFLGFTGAPQGMVQRKVIAAPMVSEGNDYKFTSSNPDTKLWLQLVQEELETPAIAELNAEAQLDEANSLINVTCATRYAIDAEKKNLKLFSAVLENGVRAIQYNNLYGQTDEDLGEFAAGGIYGVATINPYIHDHVVRQVYGTSYNGAGGLLPANFEAGRYYEAKMALELPATTKDQNNLEVVMMLIDDNTNEIVNVVKVPVGTTTNGIGGTTLGESSASPVYSLSGVCIGTKADLHKLPAGVYIVGGKKIVKE